MLSSYHKDIIAKQIKLKLQERNFTFVSMEVHEKGNKLKFTFEGAKHSHYTNVRFFSHNSTVQDSALVTRVFIRLRFLFGKRLQPVIGINLLSFKLTLNGGSNEITNNNKPTL